MFSQEYAAMILTSTRTNGMFNISHIFVALKKSIIKLADNVEHSGNIIIYPRALMQTQLVRTLIFVQPTFKWLNGREGNSAICVWYDNHLYFTQPNINTDNIHFI